MCGSEPVMGALENSTSNNHSSVGSSSDKCAFSNSGNSAENVTKKNVQEFSHVLSSPVSLLSRQSKMFEPQVTVTCRDGCSQISQPQNFPNENILFGVVQCLSQVITKFDNVFAGSLQMKKKMLIRQMYLGFLLKETLFMTSLQLKIYLEKSV